MPRDEGSPRKSCPLPEWEKENKRRIGGKNGENESLKRGVITRKELVSLPRGYENFFGREEKEVRRSSKSKRVGSTKTD